MSLKLFYLAAHIALRIVQGIVEKDGQHSQIEKRKYAKYNIYSDAETHNK
jgi:hypothetical protein